MVAAAGPVDTGSAAEGIEATPFAMAVTTMLYEEFGVSPVKVVEGGTLEMTKLAPELAPELAAELG